ncbi:TPA: site-specific DNA-methyltransferase [Candidatus Woesearchaeota archaeon]|nr:site-specific DNA-methyltransferase [Candidatus Woesearchaeota archaeon]
MKDFTPKQLTPKQEKEKEELQKQKSFNGLTAKEWASLSKNVWNDVSSPRVGKHLDHGATFPEKLANRFIQMYSKEGDLVLDPFLGTGTTLEACRNTLRNGVGIELNERFISYAKEVCKQSTLNNTVNLKVIHDDCRNLLNHLDEESVQLMVTSPPYANFIQRSVEDRKNTHKTSLIKSENNSTVNQYSEKEEDFGNLDYLKFLEEVRKLMGKLLKVTKKGGYNVWIIKDYRDTKNKIPYIPFHSDLARIGEEVGFKYHDLIVWDQTGQRKLVLLGYPSVFYTNQNCSFLVVLRKPNGN